MVYMQTKLTKQQNSKQVPYPHSAHLLSEILSNTRQLDKNPTHYSRHYRETQHSSVNIEPLAQNMLRRSVPGPLTTLTQMMLVARNGLVTYLPHVLWVNWGCYFANMGSGRRCTVTALVDLVDCTATYPLRSTLP